jgi:hypothetical protein
MQDIPRAPRVSNLPCPERKENQLWNQETGPYAQCI